MGLDLTKEWNAISPKVMEVLDYIPGFTADPYQVGPLWLAMIILVGVAIALVTIPVRERPKMDDVKPMTPMTKAEKKEWNRLNKQAKTLQRIMRDKQYREWRDAEVCYAITKALEELEHKNILTRQEKKNYYSRIALGAGLPGLFPREYKISFPDKEVLKHMVISRLGVFTNITDRLANMKALAWKPQQPTTTDAGKMTLKQLLAQQ